MWFVDNEKVTDPRVNLAIEEHLLRTFDTEEDILLFYINQPSIIIGRNQNTIEEINQEYVEKNGIIVVRRLSGGGAVYHDLGNLNFSFITQNQAENIHNFRKFTAPVIEVLREMGVPAELSGRNDIVVDGRKISGNAQYIAGRRMVSHGTLLLNSDLEQVVEALNVKASKIESKGIKSVRSRVANICEFLPEPVDMETFRLRLLHGIFGGAENVRQYHLTREDWDNIHRLTAERYGTWEWNYGHSPAFNVQKTQRFAMGEIDARIDVERGMIRSVIFYGDFIGEKDSAELAEKLTGVRYERSSLETALQGVDLSRYFAGLSLPEFLDFFL